MGLSLGLGDNLVHVTAIGSMPLDSGESTQIRQATEFRERSSLSQFRRKMMPPELQPRSYRQGLSASLDFLRLPSYTTPKIAIALVPCAAFLLDLGGTPVVATLTLGLMIAYILDSLNFKSGSFFGVWFSLIAAQIAFFFSSSIFSTFNSIPLSLLAAFLCAETNFLIGVWASLQFKWIQIENPSIVLALERLLFACVPFAASALFAWATISAVGMNNASYYLMAFNCVSTGFSRFLAFPRSKTSRKWVTMAEKFPMIF
ncbi:hypothetical protein CK203_047946 [Vitis vinifera]|uniref:Uncharacterized protein n=1 Tax=Vitis vinifera TaxID=29760 RepID=A0A438GH63_VITVI|nr:hypothetical protein CK203_047946 [Vitis vinifera]